MPSHHVVIVPHTHWDREWYRTREAFRHRLVGLLDALLDRLESDPGFRHFTLDGQTIVLSDYLEVRPGARERIAKLVGAGRLHVGPWTVLPDEWLVSGEALVRNLRLGLRDADAFGGAMAVGYVPDQFGHVGQLPQILAGFGFDVAVLWRGVGADVQETLFEWESPDGTRLLCAWLADGYGNGAHLPRDPAALAARLRGEVERQAPRRRIATTLVMNGSDHLAPDPDLPRALAGAARHLPDLSVEIGSLARYLERARVERPRDLARHRGELRSGLHAPILAGCASSRVPQKRADFENDRLLTRQLEPLAAWLARLGGSGDPELVEACWRIALENHPHDSICGCSIDAVHDEMDARFQRVASLAGAHLARVAGDLGERVAPPPGPGDVLVVWNPHGAVRAEADGLVELAVDGEPGTLVPLVARSAAGGAVAVHAEVVRAGARYAEYRLPARVVAELLRGFPGEFFGDPVCRAVRGRDAEGHRLDVWLGARPPPGLDWESRRGELADALEAEGELEVRFVPRRMTTVRVRVPDAFPGTGLRTYRLAAGEVGAGGDLRAERTAAGVRLENAAWVLEIDGAGRVCARHRPTETILDDAIRLVDEGDRGDTYTFDPVPGGEIVDGLEEGTVSLGPCSGARVEACVEGVLSVPRSLAADRRARSAERERLPVRLRVSLARGVDRVDVRIELRNAARDHRLRVLVSAPFDAERFLVESAFEVAERPIAPGAEAFGARPAERPSGATPQRRFAALCDGTTVLRVANRGLAEVAAVPLEGGGTALALTLLRAVGWLSRDDLARRPGHAGPPLETPGAQVPGSHVAELSLLVRAAGDDRGDLDAMAFAEPPLAFAGAPEGEGPLRDGDRLLEVDDPRVVVSAIEPRPDGETGLRLVNLSNEPREVELRWRGGGPGLVPVDLREAVRAGARERPQAVRRLRLAPFEIAAFLAR